MVVNEIVSGVKKFILAFIAILTLSWMTSLLLYNLLGIHSIASAWSWITIFHSGFTSSVLVSFLVITFVMVIMTLYSIGGIHRHVGTQLGIFFVLFIVVSLVVISMLFWWYGLKLDFSFGFERTLIELIAQYPGMKYIILRCTFLSLLITAFCYGWFFVYDNKPTELGDAKWANALDAQKAGFFSKKGMWLGKAFGKRVKVSGYEHFLVFASSGAGKTTGLVIPNLLVNQESMVLNDNKLTLYQYTSGYRQSKMGHDCYVWALSWHKNGFHRYNPLDLIPEDRVNRMTDIQRFCHILMPDRNEKDPIWTAASRKLLKCLILYVLDTPNVLSTLGEINRIHKQADFDDWLKELLDKSSHLDPECLRNGYSYLNNHYKTRKGILETFSDYFELFDDPLIDAATSESDFDIREIRKKKMTIYVGYSDNDLARLSPLLTVFWEQLSSHLINRLPDKESDKHDVFLFLDEYASLGKTEKTRRLLSLSREYKVVLMIVVQYLGQTEEKYTKAESKAFKNIKTKIAFSPDDIEDAKYVSELIGPKTIKIKNRSLSSRESLATDRVSRNENTQKVPLIEPSQILRLKKYQCIILRTGFFPLRSKLIPYFKDKEVKDLPCGQTVLPKHPLKQVPFVRPKKKRKEEVDPKEQEVQEEKRLFYEMQKEERQLQHEREMVELQAKIQAEALGKAIKYALNESPDQNTEKE